MQLPGLGRHGHVLPGKLVIVAEEVEEPFVRASIIVPKEYVGTVMELCNERHGRYDHMEYLSESRVHLTYRLPLAEIVARQEAIGLGAATDGEFRRAWWHFDFYGMMDNVEIYELDHGIQFQGVQTKPKGIRVTGKIDFTDHPMLDHFRFLKQHTKVMPKMCIPSPTVLHFRLEPNAVDTKAYPSRDAIFDDLAGLKQRHEIGIDNLCFGRDYPHPEGTWPNTLDWLHDAFAGVPENELRASTTCLSAHLKHSAEIVWCMAEQIFLQHSKREIFLRYS